ncbi:MAG: EMC3/TMCO1 family protein [Candidatus Bathyarchaeota archaeon]|nr:EMC3/TMCO1 family protein [Candidatus Bathyarchaeota archaeon]
MIPISQIALDFSAFATPPNATFAIMAIAAALGTTTSFIGVRSMDLETYRRLTIDSHKIRKELMEATRSGNQRRISKAQKKQQDLMAEQSKISMDRMKSSMFFTLPLLLIWPTLGRFFEGTVVAYFPFNFPYIPREMPFISWYLLCSIGFNIILNRLFGLSFEIDPED